MHPLLYSYLRSVKIGLLLLVFTAAMQSLSAQQLKIKDFAIWGGSAPAATYTPNQGVFILGNTNITGTVGTNHLIDVKKDLTLKGNFISGNGISFAGKNVVTGNLTANRLSTLYSDTAIKSYNKSDFIGNLIANGKINIKTNSGTAASTVTGKVSVPAPSINNYTGPTPTGGINNAVNVPGLPVMPANTNFDNSTGGTLDIIAPGILTPGIYRNLSLKGNATVTFSGPGNYVFIAVNNTGANNKIIFDLKNTLTGIINIYVIGEANFGEVTSQLANGNFPQRVYTEVHSKGSAANANAFTISGSNSSWIGTVWAPFRNIAAKALINNINGALWSGTGVTLENETTVVYTAPTVVEINVINPYYPPPASGKVDPPNNKIGAELFSLATNTPIVSIIPDNTTFRIQGDKVFIEVIGVNANDANLLAQLQALGMTGIVNNGPYTKIISGYFPINQLTVLNTRTNIQYVRPLYPPLNNAGQTTTQGDSAMRSDKVRDRFGVDGQGVKIGVISDSYNTLGRAPADVTDGDLPNDVQLVLDFPGHDEGRAMMQIVHDIAPKAKLAFRTGFQTAGDFAQGITDLSSPTLAGGKCDVIVDDITYITEPFLRDGKVAEAVNNAVTGGVTYFSSAGNFGAKSYESAFQDAGTNTAIIPAPATLHRFGATNADTYQRLKLNPGSYTIVLQWSDEFYSQGITTTGVMTDLDLYLVGTSGYTLFGFNRSNLNGDPFEVCPFTVTDTTEARLIVVKAGGTATNVRFKYIIFRGDGTIFDYQNASPSTIVGHPNADSCIAVGAMLYGNILPFTPVYPGVASFSSRGGSTTLVRGSTTQYTPRFKPDLVAPNGVNTTVRLGAQPAGFDDGDQYPNFFGTSAAAPHAAAVAALLINSRRKFDLQTNVSPYDIRTLLQSSAGKFPSLGNAFNFVGGNGFVRADSAIKGIANARPTVKKWEPNSAALIPNGKDAFPIKITGAYLTTTTQIYFNGQAITNTVVSDDKTVATGMIPAFPTHADPAIQLKNSAKTVSGLDGGMSEELHFFTTKKEILVRAVNNSRKYGQANPVLVAEILVDGVPIGSTTTTLADLKLDGPNLTVSTNATPNSPPQLYGIFPSRTTPLDNTNPIDAAIISKYNFTFTTGTLSVGKMNLKITPNNKTIKYGDYIGEVTYNYELDNTQPGITTLLDDIRALHKKYIADNALAVVNGFDQQQQLPDLANMSTMASFQAVSNARKFGIGNGQLQPLVNVANNAFADQRFIVDVSAQSFINYKTNPAESPLVYAFEESSKRAVLNVKSLANGVAKSGFINGQLQPIVNGQLMAMVNGQLQAVVNGQLQALVNNETPIAGVAQDYVFENGQLQALVNGSWIKITSGQLQAIVNGAEFLVNISVTNGQLQAIVNGQLMAIVNGQLQAIVNGQLLALVNGQLQALVNGQLMPIVNGQLLALVNGGQLQPIVNGQLMALVNGQLMALVNGQLMALVNGKLESITNLTQLSNGQLQALVNGQLQPIVNGQLQALVNGILSDIPTTSVSLSNNQLQALVNGQLQALVNGQLQPLVNGQLQPIVNQLQKVDGLQIINGQLQALVNGQLLPIVNGQLQAMVNGIVTTIPNASINIVNGQLQAIVNGQLQALVNGQLQPLVNGQLQAVVNGQAYPVSNLTRLSNGQLQAIVNGQLQPIVNGQLQAVVNGIATPIANADVSFANGQLQAVVNGQLQALVNGQLLAIVNGQLQPIVNGDLQPVSVARLSNGQLRAVVNGNNIPIANGQLQAIVNTGSGLTNGQLLAMVNGQLMALVNGVNGQNLTFAVIANGQLQALVNGQLQPIVNGQLQPIVNADGTIANGQLLALVNGQLQPLVNASITNGQLQALVNGVSYSLANGQLLPLVNGQLQPIVNNFGVGGTANNANTVAIVDDHDITLQGGSLGGMFAINMITGLNAGLQKLIPAAFVNDNFDVTYGLGNVTITKRPVVITAENKIKVYGDPNPTLTMTGAGFAYGETLENVTIPSISTTANTTSPIGIYPISLSGGNASNYDLILQDGTLKVDPKDLLITVGNATKVYGDQNPAFTYIPIGFVNNDTRESAVITQPVIGSAATTTSGVRTYDIIAAGGSFRNYNLVYAKGTLTVTAKDLLITANDATRVYGAANPTFTYTPTGFVNGEGAGVITTQPAITTTITSTAGVGTYPGSIVPSGGSATNYNLVYANGTLTVTGAAPFISCPSNITVNNTPGLCGANVIFAATETTGNPASTITYSIASGSLFPVGTTTVTATATNALGNSVCTFTVEVRDNQAPVIASSSASAAPINFPTGGNTISWNPMIKYFNDPLPTGAVITGASLTFTARDQGWSDCLCYDAPHLFVSGTEIGSATIYHTSTTNTINYSGAIPAYVYGGQNTLKMYFVGYPGWQAFWEGGTLTLNYQLGSAVGNITVQCASAVPAPNTSLVSATDNCSAIVTHEGDIITNQINASNYTITRTYKATDPSGNFATVTQTITVNDQTAPIAVCQPVTAYLNAFGNATITAAQVNNGSTDNCGVASMSLSKTTFTCADALVRGKALNFNVGLDGVISNAGVNLPIGNSARTISAWVNPSALNNDWGVVFQGTGNCYGLMFGLGLQSNNKLTFWGGCQDHVSNMTVPIGKWTYVAVTYDGNGSGVLYMNGQSEAFYLGALNTQASRFFVGHETSDNGLTYGTQFLGSVDEVKVYNKSLSTTEIALDLAAVNQPGLVLYYPFDEGTGTTINNAAGPISATLINPTGTNWVSGANAPAATTLTVTDANGNSSTCTAEVTVIDNQAPQIACPSQINNALDFSVFNQRVVVPHTEAIDPKTALTLEAWVNPANTSGVKYIISKGDDDQAAGHYGLLLIDNKVQFMVEFSSGLLSTIGIAPNTWTHVAGTWDGSTMNLYINGVLNATKSFTGSNGGLKPANTFPLLIGSASPLTLQYQMVGQIDEVRIWNTAKSELKLQAGKDKEISGNSQGLVGYYRMNEGTGTTIADASSYAHHGTLAGTTLPLWVPSTSPIVQPGVILAYADAGSCSKAVTIQSPARTDNCGVVSFVNSFNSTYSASGIYPVGETLVTWTATDAAGNSTTCSMKVKVVDDQAPAITCPANIPLQLAGSASSAKVSAKIINNEVVVSSTAISQNPTVGLLAPQNETKTLSGSCDCPPGHAVVGYEGRVGDIIDKFRLICAPINNDGSPAASTTFSCYNGFGVGGVAVGPIMAPAGSWMVGFQIGDQTAYYNRTGTLSSIKGYSQTYTDVINLSSNRFLNTEMRGAVSFPRTSVQYAPPGHVLVGMNYFIDNVTPGPYSNTVQFKYIPLETTKEIARIPVSDNCPGNLNLNLAGSTTFTSANVGSSNPLTILVTDANGNSSTCSTNVTVTNTTAQRSSQPATTKTKVKPTQEVQNVVAKEAIYPNPATNIIKVQLGKEVTSPNNITLVDAIGRLQTNISIRQLNNKLFELNISTLPKGVYIIRAKTIEGDKAFKFVKL